MRRQNHRNAPRRLRARGKAGKALAAAAVVAGGTQAYADAVRFENNGEFEWSRCGETIRLNLLLPAGAQDGLDSPAGIDLHRTCQPCDHYKTIELSAPSGSFVGPSDWGCYSECFQTPAPRPFRFEPGGRIEEELRGSKAWKKDAVSFYCGDCDHCAHWKSDVEGYIGFQFRGQGGVHYGWIHARLTDWDEPHLAALAWGYETESRVGIRAGAGDPPCSENSILKTACKSGKEGPELKVVAKRVTPGLIATFELDGDSEQQTQVQANKKGKAKIKVSDVAPGEHTVELRQCGLSDEVTCNP